MKILTTPNPFLHHKAKPVVAWDKKTAREAAQMIEILEKTRNPQGVGLAATQVGLDKRFFLAIINKKINIFVNPKVVKESKKMLSAVYKTKKDRWLEGCLSIPKIWGFVDRPYEVTVVYKTPSPYEGEGKGEVLITVTKTFSDAEAAYIQHEIDHLNGVLFTDRIRDQKGQIFEETDSGLTPIKLA